jgi:hypothetical protein
LNLPLIVKEKIEDADTLLRQPGVMKKNLMKAAILLVALRISDHTLTGSMIVSASREFDLSGFFTVKGPTRPTQSMTQGYNVKLCYLWRK